MDAEFTAKTSPKNPVSFPERCSVLLMPCELHETTVWGGYNRLAFFDLQSTRFINAHSKASKPQSVRFFYRHGNFVAQCVSMRNFRQFSHEKKHQIKISFNFFSEKAKKRNFKPFHGINPAHTQNFSLLHHKKSVRYSILRRCSATTAFQLKFHTVSKQF